MKIAQKFAGGFFGFALVAAPVAASAAPVSFEGVRANSQVEEAMGLGETAESNWLLILLGAAAVIGAILVIADDEPASP